MAADSNAPCIICGRRGSAHVFTKDGFELVRCLSCDLVFVANPPSPEELRRLYSFDHGYHAKFAGADSDTSLETRAARRHVADLRRYKSAGRLLDIGCSAGFFLKEARDDGWDVFGIEFSNDTAEIARSRFGLTVKTGALTEASFPSDFFDAVTMWDVVEHVRDPLAILRIVKRILKEKGVLAMETPNIDGLFPRISYMVAENLNYWTHPEPPGHLFQFSKTTIRRLIDAAGLKTIGLDDRSIALSYSFGRPIDFLRSPKRLVYALAFAPLAAIGPAFGQGDSLVVAAEKA